MNGVNHVSQIVIVVLHHLQTFFLHSSAGRNDTKQQPPPQARSFLFVESTKKNVRQQQQVDYCLYYYLWLPLHIMLCVGHQCTTGASKHHQYRRCNNDGTTQANTNTNRYDTSTDNDLMGRAAIFNRELRVHIPYQWCIPLAESPPENRNVMKQKQHSHKNTVWYPACQFFEFPIPILTFTCFSFFTDNTLLSPPYETRTRTTLSGNIIRIRPSNQSPNGYCI